MRSLICHKDFQQHSTEIKIDALPAGSYAILASSGNDLMRPKDKMILQRFDVSNISYINNGKDYFVLHRETGMPLSTVSVKYSAEVYDTKKGSYVTNAAVNIAVDSNGMFPITCN